MKLKHTEVQGLLHGLSLVNSLFQIQVLDLQSVLPRSIAMSLGDLIDMRNLGLHPDLVTQTPLRWDQVFNKGTR